VIGVALAWFLVSWVGGPAQGDTWAIKHPRHPSIEPPEVLAAIVSDRPPSFTRHDRFGSLRVVPALVSELSSSSPLPRILIGDVDLPTTPFAIGPLAFGLARRGPPAAASR
jgi:hypothetical protein